MGCRSWEENYGGNSYAITCLVWPGESFNLPAYAWLCWTYHGFSLEVGSNLDVFDLHVHIGSVFSLTPSSPHIHLKMLISFRHFLNVSTRLAFFTAK